MNSFFVSLGIENWKPVLTSLILPPVPLFALLLVAGWLLSRRGSLRLAVAERVGRAALAERVDRAGALRLVAAPAAGADDERRTHPRAAGRGRGAPAVRDRRARRRRRATRPGVRHQQPAAVLDGAAALRRLARAPDRRAAGFQRRRRPCAAEVGVGSRGRGTHRARGIRPAAEVGRGRVARHARERGAHASRC